MLKSFIWNSVPKKKHTENQIFFQNENWLGCQNGISCNYRKYVCCKLWANRFDCKFHITTLSNGTSAIKSWMISIWNGEKLNCTESLCSSHNIITLELNNINIVLRCSNSKWTGWKLNRSRRKNRREEKKHERRQNVFHFEWIMCGTCRWKLVEAVHLQWLSICAGYYFCWFLHLSTTFVEIICAKCDTFIRMASRMNRAGMIHEPSCIN